MHSEDQKNQASLAFAFSPSSCSFSRRNTVEDLDCSKVTRLPRQANQSTRDENAQKFQNWRPPWHCVRLRCAADSSLGRNGVRESDLHNGRMALVRIADDGKAKACESRASRLGRWCA